MPSKRKILLILAGANGSGKTTLAEYILPKEKILEFVNADEIAKGLSPFNPAGQRVKAGKLVLQRIGELIAKGESFAIESTLSGTSQTSVIQRANRSGYEIRMHYIYTNNVRINRARIRMRVRQGGHDVPVADIERRYHRSLKNFFALYEPICDMVDIYDNSEGEMIPVAGKSAVTPGAYLVYEANIWNEMIEMAEK